MHSSQGPSARRWSGLSLSLPLSLISAIALLSPALPAKAETPLGDRAITIRSDIQEANSKTGVVTARGNVQVFYPARQMQATSAQAQYYDREQRLVLTGNVYILQEGNSLRGEVVTYLIDEGYFVAVPEDNRQVESIYLLSDPTAPPETPDAPAIPPLNPKPAFKAPLSPPPGYRSP